MAIKESGHAADGNALASSSISPRKKVAAKRDASARSPVDHLEACRHLAPPPSSSQGDFCNRGSSRLATAGPPRRGDRDGQAARKSGFVVSRLLFGWPITHLAGKDGAPYLGGPPQRPARRPLRLRKGFSAAARMEMEGGVKVTE